MHSKLMDINVTVLSLLSAAFTINLILSHTRRFYLIAEIANKQVIPSFLWCIYVC